VCVGLVLHIVKFKNTSKKLKTHLITKSRNPIDALIYMKKQTNNFIAKIKRFNISRLNLTFQIVLCALYGFR